MNVDLISAQLFLSALFAEVPNHQLIELRLITNEKKVQTYFFKVTDLEEMIKAIGAAQEANVYFGVLPRSVRKGDLASINFMQTFFADIDAKDFGGSKEDALASIDKFPLKPTVLIDSGNGYHAYWMLSRGFELTDGNKEEAKLVNRALHAMISGDHTHDLPRILRVPGTLNVKNEDNPVMCKIHKFDLMKKYTFEEIKKNVDMSLVERKHEDLYKLNLEGVSRIHTFDDVKALVPIRVLDRAKKIPDELEDDRSANDFWVAVHLYEAKLTDVEVLQTFKIFGELNWAAGQKGEADMRYLIDYTLPAAKGKSNLLDISFEKLMHATDKGDKLYIAEGILKLISKKTFLEQEMYLAKLHDLLGGKNIISLATLKQKMKFYALKNVGPYKFFGISDGVFTFIPALLGRHLLTEFSVMYLNSKLYVYLDGVFKEKGEILVSERIRILLDSEWNTRRRDEVLAWLKDATIINDDELPKIGYLINVRNGMLDVSTGVLTEHDPKYKSIVQLDVHWNPEADTSEIEKFVQEVFDDDVVDLMWEFAGYTITPNLEYKKFMILTGKGNNGKSVWLNIISSVIGAKNISNEPLQKLAHNVFSVANLYGKVANINADLESQDIKHTGLLKMLTGGDTISAEFKYGNTFYFTNKARMIFSCNEMPIVQDYNDAFFDRLLIVKCSRQFILGVNADPNLQNRLTQEPQKSAWLKMAIRGAQSLIQNKKFSESPSVQREQLLYRFSSDSVTEFVQDRVIKTGNVNDGITKDAIYYAYKQWCVQNGRLAVASKTFNKRAVEAPNYLSEAIIHQSHRHIVVFKGIQITSSQSNAQIRDNKISINDI